jgi:hypothetical protein
MKLNVMIMTESKIETKAMSHALSSARMVRK